MDETIHACDGLNQLLCVFTAAAINGGHQDVPQRVEVLGTQIMINLTVWFASSRVAHKTLCDYYPRNAGVAERSKLAPFVALLHVAAKVGGMPEWSEAHKEGVALEAQLADFARRQKTATLKNRQALLDQLRTMVPGLAARLLKSLHGLQRPGQPLPGGDTLVAVRVPEREHEALREVATLTAVYLRQLLVMYPSSMDSVLAQLKAFYMSCHDELGGSDSGTASGTASASTSTSERNDSDDDNDSDSGASAATTAGETSADRLAGMVSQLTERLERVQTDQRDQREVVAALKYTADRMTHQAAEAMARAAAAEQIAEAADAKAAAAEKRATQATVTAQKLAKKQPSPPGPQPLPPPPPPSPSPQQHEQRVVKAELAAAKAVAVASAAQQRAAVAEQRAQAAEVKAAALEARMADVEQQVATRLHQATASQAELAQLAARLAALDETAARLAALKPEVEKLQREMAWVLPQVQHDFVARWNGAVAQWNLQQQLQQCVGNPFAPVSK